MRPKRRRSRPKGSKQSPAARAPEGPASERGAPVTPPPAPEPVEPPPPQEDPRVGELQEQLTELTHKLEGLSHPEGGDVDERFQGMEERMKSLLQLSEILSVRYNPFLEEEEASIYDDQDIDQFLPESMRGQGLGARAPRGAEVVPIEPDPDVPLGPANVAHAEAIGEALGKLSPGQEELEGETQAPDDLEVELEEEPLPEPEPHLEPIPPPARAPGPPAPKAAPAPEPPLPKPIPKRAPEPPTPAPVAPPAQRPAPESAATAPAHPSPAPAPIATPATPFRPAPPRSAYFALCWFERLASAGDPAEIHLFLDHYERLGWIPADDRGWLRELAIGIAPRRADLSWDDLQLTGPDLARLHREHLRLLERLFHTGLVDDSPDAWERQADGLLGGI